MISGKIALASVEVEYEVIRSSRRTMALYVKPGGAVIVRAPRYVPAYIIRNFVESKSAWIIKHHLKLKNLKSNHTEISYADASSVPYMGKDLTIKLLAEKRFRVVAEDGELKVCGPDMSSADKVKALVEGWYLKEARKFFEGRTAELVSKHNDVLPSPKSVSVRKMKKRWGTCKSDGSIWFNRELIKRDPDLIDSVIIHELCHLVHHNHGKEFYALLGSIVPDHREKRNELRQCW